MYATETVEGVGITPKSMAELLAARVPAKPTIPKGRTKLPNRERIALIEELVIFMGEGTDPKVIDKRIPYWLGRLRKMEDSWIRDTMKQAKTGSNPPALFNFLLKKHLLTLTKKTV